ncbi:hypothetical protein T492DRAFT_849338 [Pavlovales sp. CCMP2436]|nr:hypothetical protein T492DRAFT_849338 [Pavlovales sp. CCMP2436]
MSRQQRITDAMNAAIVSDTRISEYVETAQTVFSQCDTNFSFTQVMDVSSSGSGSGSGSGDFLIADAPTDILDITPIASRGRPKKGEIKDKELIAAEHNETRKKNSRELKNAETRIKRLQEIIETVFAAGGIKHKDTETMKDIVSASGANSLTIISPLRRGYGSYIYIDNPSPAARIHGVPITPIVMLLCSLTHVESFTGQVNNGTWCISSSESIKLGVEDMTIKYNELKDKEQLIVYPSGCYDCPQKIICMYVFGAEKCGGLKSQTLL